MFFYGPVILRQKLRTSFFFSAVSNKLFILKNPIETIYFLEPEETISEQTTCISF